MKKHLLVAIGTLVLLSSCSHYYYAPNTHNVPVFKEKNEVRVSASYSTIQKISGDVQAAYAPSKHLGIIASVTLANLNPDKTGSDGRGHLYELGAGYFKPFGPKKEKQLFVFEVYGVAGLGGCRGYYPNWQTNNSSDVPRNGDLQYPNNYVTTRFVKAYLQPSISISHDIADFSLSAKIGVMNNYKVTNTIPDSIMGTLVLLSPPGNGTLSDDLGVLAHSKTAFIFEPAATVRLGFKYVKLQVQYSFNVPTNTFLKELGSVGSFSVGLSFNIAPRFKKYGWAPTPTD